MKAVATCTCGQLTIETIGQPEPTTDASLAHPSGSETDPSVIYFHTDNIAFTHGEAECITRHYESHTTNVYFCEECLCELFAVPQTRPSLIAIFSSCFQNRATATHLNQVTESHQTNTKTANNYNKLQNNQAASNEQHPAP